ncbi:hypothetical protein BvCmsNSNP024_03402 [Escherichia coli]|nr:hypothetical protein BvCmsNSNP024_03402 [Escherichia coli]
MIADGCTVTHLETERFIVGLHLFEGGEDINFSIPASPVATNTDHLTDAFVVAQFIYLDANITWFNAIATDKANSRQNNG